MRYLGGLHRKLDRPDKFFDVTQLIFILISLGLVISLKFATIYWTTVILYFLYFFVTLYSFQIIREDFLSPLSFFIFFSWLGFGLKVIFISIYPDLAFFSKGYNVVFRYDSLIVFLAFLVFFIGYVGFITGFMTFKKTPKFILKGIAVSPSVLSIISVMLIVISYYIRIKYKLGMVGVVPTVKYAGIIYYLSLYPPFLIVILEFYSALKKNSIFYVIIGLILFSTYSLINIVCGWKGSLIPSILSVSVIFYYVSKYRLFKIKRIKTMRIITFGYLFLLFFSFSISLSYP